MTGEEAVIPGDKLGVEEEYLAGGGVYVDSDGYLKSKLLGLVNIDQVHHIIDVKPYKESKLPLRQGDTVYAVVDLIRDPVAYLKIFYIESRNVEVFPPVSGILTISNVSTSRVKTLYAVIGYGDILRAFIIEPGGPPYLLSIKGREYGVVTARCPKCLTPLRLKGMHLVCPACKTKAKRKISIKYVLRG
ncbi:exosome complex RNA-binding protein Csl4 [Infirmifilum lucidum]|uniref:Exosome complex component Csl4 n=1 Tax=Infirmifilum lucidum TaxID=2776706 RepID=A0A7L9FGU3_9CREN|nr:exosome complex RNA-binding protein Csl4 [Infirmifilum lucidum]QOJ78164.1 exosome complex RNA-binding protein Csl4 [Infirmifilum lucidum]